MQTGRTEAFSDGVIAIIITIMVLEMKVPHEPNLSDLKALAPVFISYVLSFIYIGIYWCNHHHLMQAAQHVSGRVLWSNLHLLFWLSLIPFVTNWMGAGHFESAPVALYGFVLLMAGIAYFLLSRSLVAADGKRSPLGKAIGKDYKGMVSVLVYALAIVLALIGHSASDAPWLPWVSFSLYVVVATIWFIPDKRIEDKIPE